MISSTVYGQEEFLDQIHAILTGYGFDVWMSHKGTLPLSPRQSNFDNCIDAVRNCDVFLGLITGRYGSGRERNDRSITHQEVLEAVRLNKPRFFLVHRDVTIARQLLAQFRAGPNGKRRRHTFFKPTSILDDIRILDMYDAAIQADIPLSKRTGNWVQQYRNSEDILIYLHGQFSDHARIRRLMETYK